MRRIKLFILAVLTITMICSCKNKVNEKDIKINETADSFEKMRIIYRVDISRIDMYILEIDFTTCKATLTHEDDENEMIFSVMNYDKLANFIINNVLKKCESGDWDGDTIDMTSNNATGNQDSSETKKILWDMSVLTTNDLYTYSLFDKYPAFWYEMWDIICEVTGQSYSTFGIQEN